MSSKRLDCSV